MKRIATLVITLIVTSLSFLADAQQRYTISCKFVDSKGLPIPGVTLKEVGTTIGTSSDLDGNVTLTVSSSTADVTASIVGYEEITQKAYMYNMRVILKDVSGESSRKSESKSFFKTLRSFFLKYE